MKNKDKVLNAMDFGIPQKRERIFVVSVLRKNNFDFEKLEKIPTKHISEFLEKDVSKIYKVRQKSILSNIQGNSKNIKYRDRLKIIDKYAYTISTKQVRVPDSGIIDLGNGKYRYLT